MDNIVYVVFLLLILLAYLVDGGAKSESKGE